MFAALKRKIIGSIYRVTDQLIWRTIMENRAFDYERVAYMQASARSAEFFQSQMRMTPNLVTRGALLDHAMKQASNAGLWLEFGVYKGDDIRKIARQHAGNVYGFDSFEGLPEDWTHFQKKGRFSLEGRLPERLPANVKLIQGWFHDTLPPFLDQHQQPIAFLHIDSDLYSSAKTVLHLVHDRLRAGTIIQFDDFLNYPGWEDGEHKAFQEFVELSSLKYEYIGFASSDQAVALRVIDIQPPVGTRAEQVD